MTGRHTRPGSAQPAAQPTEGPLRTGAYVTWQGRRWRVITQLTAEPCGRCRVPHHDWWLRPDTDPDGGRLFLPGCRLAEISEVSK